MLSGGVLLHENGRRRASARQKEGLAFVLFFCGAGLAVTSVCEGELGPTTVLAAVLLTALLRFTPGTVHCCGWKSAGLLVAVRGWPTLLRFKPGAAAAPMRGCAAAQHAGMSTWWLGRVARSGCLAARRHSGAAAGLHGRREAVLAAHRRRVQGLAPGG